MATETNAIASYQDLKFAGVKVNGSYESNQMVKYEDIIVTNTYYIKGTIESDVLQENLNYKEFAVGDNINNSITSSTVDLFFYKEPKNSKIDITIPGFEHGLTVGCGGQPHQIHDIKYTVQIIIYKTPCDENGNTISSPSKIQDKTLEYIFEKNGSNGQVYTGTIEEQTLYVEGDNTTDKYYKLQLQAVIKATENEGNIAQEIVRTEASLYIQGGGTYIIGCMEK